METLFEFLNVQLVNLAIYRQLTNAALDNNNNNNINNNNNNNNKQWLLEGLTASTLFLLCHQACAENNYNNLRYPPWQRILRPIFICWEKNV